MTANVRAIAGAIVTDALRRKVVYIVVFFGFVMAAAIPSLPSYGMGVVNAYFREVSLAVTFAVSLVLALALAVARIPGEVERRTVYNVLSKRVGRWEYVVGTWLGLAVVMAVFVAALTVISQGIALATYHQFMWRLWEGALGVWLEVIVLTAFAVMFSTFTSAIPVTVATLTFLFIAHSRGGLSDAFAGQPLMRLYPSLDTLNIINPVAHGHGVTPAYMGTMLLVGAGWVLGLLALGVLGFQRRDL